MSGAPVGAHALELLEGALAYASGSLQTVTVDDLARPTPCAGWDLDRLLTHMDDALDAFTEGASGFVRGHTGTARPPARTDVAPRLDGMRVKACDLLTAWRSPRAAAHAVVGAPARGSSASGARQASAVSTEVIALAAALEITVHGWDVGRATGSGARVPLSLAQGLLPTAHHLIGASDRPVLFAAIRPTSDDALPDVRLLAWCGRVAG
ncbi:TIGR03086 family metal-binding protein [Nocardioides sp. R-C-SC26]|uniref:TIGR03086 family metal-binding protein n=1 Tax=Nocardioides sp. R-C-SC26 TaxID=2870414 RepID=UPI001E5779E7|nr:TIGR03086 family metal-binding protein [Nocardioides sp. R-C-SC26]